MFSPTQALFKRFRKLRLTTKDVNKGFYKGTRTGRMGRHNRWGGYTLDYSLVRTYVVPKDLDTFKVRVPRQPLPAVELGSPTNHNSWNHPSLHISKPNLLTPSKTAHSLRLRQHPRTVWHRVLPRLRHGRSQESEALPGQVEEGERLGLSAERPVQTGSSASAGGGSRA